MMKTKWYLLLLLVHAIPSLALVDPVLTSQTVPGWMAEIQVRVNGGPAHVYCKGALIAPQWVVSTGRCVVDPNHYLDNLDPGEEAKFSIKLGTGSDAVEVENSYLSDDYSMALYRLAVPSQAAPLALSTKSAAQLLGAQLTILNSEKSEAVYHGFFNPGVTAPSVICRISGVEYTLNGAFCSVRTKMTISANLYMSTGTVIDPTAATAPATSLDKAVTIDKSGKHLYLDFRTSRTYPCTEDSGLPLLAKDENNSDEMVGIVSGAGALESLEVCGMSLVNEFASATAIKSFFDKINAKYDFSAVCPSTPVASISYTGGAGVSLKWSSVKGATGYKVLYTTRLGQVPFATVDVSTQTTINTTLAHGVDYLVAVIAYNANCSSALSKQLPVNVDLH